MVKRARFVLYEKVGPGEHPCHWCGGVLRWMVGSAESGAICTDHLDGDVQNDAPANLVVSCRGCNANRARPRTRRKIEETPCEVCGQPFVARSDGSRRFCSISCSSTATAKRGLWAEHGSRSRYVRGCRCEPCRSAQRVYMAEYEKAHPRRLR